MYQALEAGETNTPQQRTTSLPGSLDMSPPAHDELFLAIGRLEGKVDSLLAIQSVQQEEIRNIDSRLRQLENAKAVILGGAGIVSVAVTVFINLLHK